MNVTKPQNIFLSVIVLFIGVILKTHVDTKPISLSLQRLIFETRVPQITDRNGHPLTISYQNNWNTYNTLPIYKIPNFLKQAFLVSEDKRFYEHNGVDWEARAAALKQNIKALGIIRGASTITEQVARMIHPKPRSIWSKWIETFEAISLENKANKEDIFEFYLNQLPYASNRRGIVQAAWYYFNRDLSTLNYREMLALVVLARAPSSFDLYKNPNKISSAINRLAERLFDNKVISAEELAQIKQCNVKLEKPIELINASHFVHYIRDNFHAENDSKIIRTTLDANLQLKVQNIIDDRVKHLKKNKLHNAAALVIDHTTREVLAWVVAGANNFENHEDTPGRFINAVITPRQPGSSLKPFLYALALENGWNATSTIEDSPLAEAIGTGLHRFKNYSNTYYGKVTLREALANSLNIPALRLVQHLGVENYLATLHSLGFYSLNRGADIYDEGLALGTGEVTLLELVQAYAVLANRGVFRPLSFIFDNHINNDSKIFSEEATSLIANILSDPWARRLEFGNNSVLNLPVQTAVKTGTSTDYRDAWVVGFNYKYVVGIWMGNLDQTPTDGITGAYGPALALRSIFSELNKYQKTTPLYLSPKLIKQDICNKGSNNSGCLYKTEYFIGSPPTEESKLDDVIELVCPTDGLEVAIDPRIPKDKQKLQFRINKTDFAGKVEWFLDGEFLAESSGEYLWPLERGKHKLQAIIHQDNNIKTLEATFTAF